MVTGLISFGFEVLGGLTPGGRLEANLANIGGVMRRWFFIQDMVIQELLQKWFVVHG